MSKETNKKPPVSDDKLDKAFQALTVLHWDTLSRRSEAKRILDRLHDPIENARKSGASWPVIAYQIERTTGYKISVPTIRSFFKQKAIPERELEAAQKKGETVFDLSAEKEEQPAA